MGTGWLRFGFLSIYLLNAMLQLFITGWNLILRTWLIARIRIFCLLLKVIDKVYGLYLCVTLSGGYFVVGNIFFRSFLVERSYSHSILYSHWLPIVYSFHMLILLDYLLKGVSLELFRIRDVLSFDKGCSNSASSSYYGLSGVNC